MSTTIEWTQRPDTKGETWNPVVGCSRKSTGCEHCYAELMASRIANASMSKLRTMGEITPKKDDFGVTYLQQAMLEWITPTQRAYMQSVKWKDGGAEPASWFDTAVPQWNRKLIPLPHTLSHPLMWKQPRTVFVNSMSDLFHEDVPFDFIDQVFAVMALTPQHTYQILTKRPERMAQFFSTRDRFAAIPPSPVKPFGDTWEAVGYVNISQHQHPLPNVWLGTSVENQTTADERIPHLLKCPAAVRFLSCEPLLGALDLDQFLWLYDPSGCIPTRMPVGGWDRPQPIGWVITGGESGHKARPMHPDWARSLRDQCKGAGVPFFFKQWGQWGHYGEFSTQRLTPQMIMSEQCVWMTRDGRTSPNNEDPYEMGSGNTIMAKVGKKDAGNLLDGKEHHEWPKVATA